MRNHVIILCKLNKVMIDFNNSLVKILIKYNSKTI